MNTTSSKKYNIIILDDHSVVREGLKNAINAEENLQVVSEFSNGRELLDNLNKLEFDLVVLDISMPKMNGIKVLDEIELRFPGTKVLILTMHKERVYIKQTLRKGIRGYILKSDPMDDLLHAIDEIMAGRKYFSRQIMHDIVDDYSKFMERHKFIDELSEREIEVLKLITNGQSVKDTANDLNISPRTVESHKYKIMEKLQVNNMTELIKFSIINNLI